MKLNRFFLVFFLIFSSNLIAQKPNYSKNIIEKAKGIHERVITIDTHIDINVNNFTQSKNYTQNLESQVNLPKIKEGGLDVPWFIVYTGQGSLDSTGYATAYKNAIAKFKAIHTLVEEYAPKDIELALTSADVKRIHSTGKKAAMIGVENAYPMGLDIQNVKNFYDMGARYMSLAHNGHSQFSDSNTGEEDGVWLYNGLSELGKKAVFEMNKYGIMVDISHPSREANIQMIQLSKAPVIASHSSARALCNVSRNLDDELLLMLKKNGGVVQTVAFKSYLNTDKNNAYLKAQRDARNKVIEENNFKFLNESELKILNNVELEAYYKKLKEINTIINLELKKASIEFPPVNVSDFVDHIDYMVELIGIDHVGISSDFDGGGGIEGWKDASETFNVTLELVQRGYTEEQIDKLWGLNLLRVMDKVQKVAKEIQAK